MTGQWFSLGPPVSSTNKTDRHNITEILLNGALSNIKQQQKPNINWETSNPDTPSLGLEWTVIVQNLGNGLSEGKHINWYQNQIESNLY